MTWPSDTTTYSNYGPPLVRGRPRCGHCGRFVKPSMDDFGDHLENDCPVGGYFNTNGVLMSATHVRRAA